MRLRRNWVMSGYTCIVRPSPHLQKNLPSDVGIDFTVVLITKAERHQYCWTLVVIRTFGHLPELLSSRPLYFQLCALDHQPRHEVEHPP